MNKIEIMKNNKDLRVKILVVTHKDFDDSIIPQDAYQVIKVGDLVSSSYATERGWLTDDTGDNIATENPYYCELTAHYWAWKNLTDVDVVGIVHYRRYFMDYNCNKEFKDNILTKQKLLQIFARKKAIMPFWQSKIGNYFMLDKSKPNEDEGLWRLRQIISEYYPAVLASFDNVAFGRLITFGNMAILKKEDFDEYSSFLFKVLREYDTLSTADGYSRNLRSLGYLGEILLPVWVLYRFREFEIYRLDVKSSETTDFAPKTMFGRFRMFRPLLVLVRYLQYLWLRFQ